MSVSAIELKKQEVEVIKNKIDSSVATVVVEYAGLTVEEFSELRTQLRAENVELSVIKNNISRRAFSAVNINELEEDLKGPVAIAFSKEDVTAAAKILNNYAKKHKALVLKSGTLEGVYASAAQVQELALLPNKEGMLSMLLSVLEAPIRGLAQVTKQVANQKEEN